MDSYIKVSDDKLFIDIEKDDVDVQPVDIKDYLHKIESRSLSIGVVGLGYSGLQIATAFASAGFTVTGIEFDKDKAHQLNSGVSLIEHVSSDLLKKLVDEDRFFAATDFDVLPELDVVIVCDQMPTRVPKNTDLSFIMAVMENIISSLDKPKLIILDHPSEPGTCREVIYPLFEDQHKNINKDYFLAVSPERVDHGNTSVNFSLIPRVVAGMTIASKELAVKLFSTVVKTVVEVSCPTSAEMVKFLETSYRWVNTALINETMITCNKYNISIWEIIKAVRSNPFEYFRFLPGPGYGSTSQYNEEPFLLSVRKNLTEMKHDIVDKAIEINTYVSRRYIVDRISDLLNSRRKCLNGANILIVGIASKRNMNEWNESPAIEIILQLLAKQANVYYHDPYIPKLKIHQRGFSISSIDLDDEMLSWVDLVVILMDHQKIDYRKILDKSSLILDTRNATEKIGEIKDNVKLL
jgi:UDP-N-acetyl-D-glucosamine dehydrogenase